MSIFEDPFVSRNFVYGIEDSLVSTTGVIVGIALAGFTNKNIITTGAILILVEALSMAFGSFVSEDTFLKTSHSEYTMYQVLHYALVMFFAYLLAGIIPLIPFMLELNEAWKYSVFLATSSLFALIYIFQKNTNKALLQTSIGFVILVISSVTGKYI